MDAQETTERMSALGIDALSREALPLLPIVRVAWADGDMTRRARALILKFAQDRAHMSEEGMILLRDWLLYAPSPRYIERALRLIRDLIDDRAPDIDVHVAHDALDEAHEVARVTGGFFGFGVVSDAEAAALEEIEVKLAIRHGESICDVDPTAWRSRITSVPDGSSSHYAGVIVVGTGEARRKVRVPPYGMEIGAGMRADLQLSGAGLAQRHCRVTTHAGRFYVEDLASPAGTLVDGERVGLRRLLGGETLQLGSVRVVFKIGVHAPAPV